MVWVARSIAHFLKSRYNLCSALEMHDANLSSATDRNMSQAAQPLRKKLCYQEDKSDSRANVYVQSKRRDHAGQFKPTDLVTLATRPSNTDDRMANIVRR